MPISHKIVRILFLAAIPVFFLCCTAVKIPPSDPTGRSVTGELTIHFIDVGQGDSTFIILPGGENILIDTGSPVGGPIIVSYLNSLGINRIDHLILTHPHDDHIGGIFSVLSEFEVDDIYDNGFNNFESAIYGDYIGLVRKDLSRYNILQAGEALRLDYLNIEVLNPLLPPTGNLNEDSIVLRLHFGDIKIFLCGDIGIEGEKRLLNLDTELSSHVIKIGHHGDKDAGSIEFLNKVNPEVAVISVGKINDYSQPHPELLNRLIKSGIEIYRTDAAGHVIFKTDGKTYSINTNP